MADRINLFRAQTIRSVGGNAWRMAHNPPTPARLDFMDRLGMLCDDENRDYGGNRGQGGTTVETVSQVKDKKSQNTTLNSILPILSVCTQFGDSNSGVDRYAGLD